jgi:hypothetical protein
MLDRAVINHQPLVTPAVKKVKATVALQASGGLIHNLPMTTWL